MRAYFKHYRMNKDFEFAEIGDRKIVVRGIGKLFYQEGFPISMAISECNKRGWEVSLLHVADECLKNGWSAKTTIAKLRGETDLDIDGSMGTIDWPAIELFCRCDYETQRELIFNYLWKDTEQAKDFLRAALQPLPASYTL